MSVTIEKPTDAQSAVGGHDHFGHGGHPDDVGPDHSQETVLGARFQIRTADTATNTP
jgi:hypothetical protein